jgi:ferredoxin
MKIHVDPALCQGHNRCEALAPSRFDIDDEGFAELAVDNCPEQAIKLDRDA